jgi:hypothetical protein
MKSIWFRGAAIVAIVGYVVGYLWFVSLLEQHNSVDCQLAQERKDLRASGTAFAAQFEAGSPRPALVKSAHFVDFTCVTVCADGTRGKACSPAPLEQSWNRCYQSQNTKHCRHTVYVYGQYVDDRLVDALSVRMYSRKRHILTTWF